MRLRLKVMIVFGLAACCFWIAGCASQSDEAENVNKENNHMYKDGIVLAGKKISSTGAAEDASFQPKDFDDRMRQAQTAFAIDMFQQLREKEAEDKGGNVFFSPLSIAVALSMAANGATDETLESMLETMHLDQMSLQDMNYAQQVLMDLLSHSGEEVRVSIANSLWAKEGLAFEEPFLNSVETYYGSEITSLNLQSDEAADRINQWVSDKTEGKITEIVDGPISDETILFLLNAIYFNANWANPFEDDKTEEKPFHSASGKKVNVPMMSNSGQFSYLEGSGFEALRLPYKESNLSMVVFLPDENLSLDAFAEQMSTETWKTWLSSFGRASGTIEMPRFQIEYDTSLKDVLSKLGMENAFAPGEAQFGNMISLDQHVYLQDVKHKAVIDVQEKGTEAAAVTSISVGLTSAPSKTFAMTLDRPFLFAIHDQRTDAILFMGTVNEL